MTVFMSRRHAYQAKLRHHFPGRHSVPAKPRYVLRSPGYVRFGCLHGIRKPRNGFPQQREILPNRVVDDRLERSRGLSH
jgi:hypothetical protein